jgi:hypothetical protein
VVTEYPVGPGARREGRLVALYERRNFAGVPGGGEQVEIEGQVDARAVVGGEPLHGEVELPDHHGVVVVERPAHRGDGVVDLGPVGVVDGQEGIEGPVAGPVIRVGRIVPKLFVLDQVPQSVHPEAVHAPLQPEAQHI